MYRLTFPLAVVPDRHQHPSCAGTPHLEDHAGVSCSRAHAVSCVHWVRRHLPSIPPAPALRTPDRRVLFLISPSQHDAAVIRTAWCASTACDASRMAIAQANEAPPPHRGGPTYYLPPLANKCPVPSKEQGHPLPTHAPARPPRHRPPQAEVPPSIPSSQRCKQAQAAGRRAAHGRPTAARRATTTTTRASPPSGTGTTPVPGGAAPAVGHLATPPAAAGGGGATTATAAR